ncbi:SIR2 family protein [Ruminococcus flavefaciens]|uniref:SIR2-like domain-containing protein n=1 Tax=Ruminococcus flavefaciens TaxID=1265 RepID=A0A1K1PVD3_RUMFL|nr:SIR2 family protein [Ruminococcus flavefaciens]SFW51648.1 SIR2-like domain-containing protein [Ruminococcus flavefaciens]
MNIDEAIKKALNGDAILFLGSGASVDTPNIGGGKMLIGSKLAEKLQPGTTDLQQATELFVDEQNENGNDGEQELINFLIKEFRCTCPLNEHRELVDIKWKRIYTTNYDDIIESAYKEKSLTIKSATLSSDIKECINNNDLTILHINGYINSITKSKLNDEFKLSSYSYNTDQFTNSQWGALFKNDLNSYSTTIFIGFSMGYDLDIRRIVNTINKDKCIFIVHDRESTANIKTLSKYGEVCPIGLSGFINKVNEIKKDYIPPRAVDLVLSNFEVIESPKPLSAANDRQVLQYYYTGIRSDELYYIENKNYKSVVLRDYVEKIINDITSGIKAVFIHSDIGNGKSEIIEQVCMKLPNTYQKYRLIDENQKINIEIEEICNNGKKNIIVIENFFDYYDVFKNFNIYNCNDNIVFIFSARTSIYRSRSERFEIDPCTVYEVNRLSNNEISQIERIFSTYGFYPPEKNITLSQYIKKNCNKRLQSLLISVMKNVTITDKIWTVCQNKLDSEYKYYKLVLFLIVIKLMALNLNMNDTLDLLKINSFDYSFDRDEDLYELIDRSVDRISIKSSILCLWILSKTKCIDDIIELLIDTAKVADCGFLANRKYKNYLTNLLSFKHLKFVLEASSLNQEQKLDKINHLYGELKELTHYKNQYFFWLQYAISALELNDYEGAELHFRAAYRYLPDKMTPYEINNQYARLKMELLLKESYKYSELSTIEEIEKIDELLTPTKAEKDEEYYCYKMASSYYPRLFDKFYAIMTTSDKTIMTALAKKNYNGCSTYLRYSTNSNFYSHLKSYIGIFGELAFYNDKLDFTVTSIKKSKSYILYLGYVVINDEKKDACIKNYRGKKYKESDKIPVRIYKYDSVHNDYVLKVAE